MRSKLSYGAEVITKWVADILRAQYVQNLIVLLVFLGLSFALRGAFILEPNQITPDEAESLAQARAALRSPVAFTTWVTSTTGPYWVYFLTALHALGMPLTIPAAHILAAELVGYLAFAVYVIFRRRFGGQVAFAIAAVWWLPLILVGPMGSALNFGGLETELLPLAFIASSFLMPRRFTQNSPLGSTGIAFLLLGIACGMKYQVIPVALAAAAFHLSIVWQNRSLRKKLIGVAIGLIAAPTLLWLLSVFASGLASYELIAANVEFLVSYSKYVSLSERIRTSWISLLSVQWLFWPFLGAVLASIWSNRPTAALRMMLIVSGVLCVFLGGFAAPHYLLIPYLIMAVAAGIEDLGGQPGTLKVPSVKVRFTVILSALLAATFWFWPYAPGVKLAGFNSMVRALNSTDTFLSRELAVLCPKGSKVIIWGWDAQLYVQNDWENTLPFVTIPQITISKRNLVNLESRIRQSIQDSDCVIDAVGKPFGLTVDYSLPAFYPTFAAILDRDFEKIKPEFCEDCTVYRIREIQ